MKMPGRVLSPSEAGRGYLTVQLGRAKRAYIHRLVAEAFLGPASHPDATVNHIDGDKLNNGAANLEWCSYSENETHKVRVLLKGIGQQHGNAKLTDAQAREIRASSDNSDAIALRVGVTARTVRKIKQGTRWRWLDE